MSIPVLGYDRVGSGEPLVLLHGFGSTRDDFAALIPDLARDFEVYSIDLPRHGNSPMITGRPSVAALTDAIEADLDAHGLDRVHVLGNRWVPGSLSNWPAGTARCPWCRSPPAGSAPRWNDPTKAR